LPAVVSDCKEIRIMNLKAYDFRKISLIAITIILSWAAFGVFITPDVTVKNTTLINGHFLFIKKDVHKGDVSYDLYIKENEESYKISADGSHCFLYGSFVTEIKDGQPVQLYLNRRVPFFSIRKPMIVRIVANDYEYLSFDCTNDEIADEKIKMPLMCLLLEIIVGCLIYKKKIKELLKEKT